MVETGDVVMLVEIVLLLSLIFGSYFGRKLNMRGHHTLIYTTVAIQGIVFVLWMAPGVGYWLNKLGVIPAILGLHITIGAITGFASIILCGVFIARKNDYDLPLLRWTKPLMVFTLFSWILSFVFGAIFYYQVHFLRLYD